MIINLHLQSAVTYIVMAAFSKVVAVVVTYPYQVVRSRLQVCVKSYIFKPFLLC